MPKHIQQTIGHLIFPASELYQKGTKNNLYMDSVVHKILFFDEKKLIFPTLSFQNFLLETENENMFLDSIEFSSGEQDSPVYIIHFLGNGEVYESYLIDMAKESQNLKCHVIGFNHRGVAESKGYVKDKDDLVKDGIFQVQRLLNNGVDPEYIFLKGQSLGAAIATLVTSHFHALEPTIPINVFNARSFTTLTRAITGITKNTVTSKLKDSLIYPLAKGIGKFTSWISSPLVKVGLWATNWEINALSAYQRIPDDYKDHIVIRRLDVMRGDEIDDEVIDYCSASLHARLKEENHASIKNLQRQFIYHGNAGGHNVPLTYIYSCHTGESGQHYFENFVTESLSKHKAKYLKEFNL